MATKTTDAAKAAPKTNMIIGPVRFSFAHLIEPKIAKGSKKPKYSVSILIPKDDTDMIAGIESGIKAAIAVKFGDKPPKILKLPMRDGDKERDDDVYADHLFIGCTCDQRPGFVDQKNNPIANPGPDMFYSGMFGRVSVNFKYFEVEGNKGIACYLQNVQFVKHGENLTGRKKAEEDFADDAVFEDDQDDDLK